MIFSFAILDQSKFTRVKLSDDHLRVALEVVVSENAVLGRELEDSLAIIIISIIVIDELLCNF